ncbi:MAG TPA: tRNA (uridine(34)/cytosine(34)/5-carboxymethylaminomethyluridine(34)-2'-O)-methyltransferase TrmL [Ruminococcus sp.]|nr:tRNA (uridine(34)/cytosine(34)/5-carboxymethylaminomethyluridine(34)-2'-O)-methyltransferase TrmL [Ruminococcus sp.]
MYNINIVLHEPQIPQNTGNIARTCAITGAALHLIKPFGFKITDKNLKRAGLDYWDKLEIYYYENLEDFFSRNPDADVYYFTTKGKNVYSNISYPDNSYIMFGREDRGLPETLLHDNPEKCVRIPMRNKLRSLNLSNSVAISVYEILRQWDFPELSKEGKLTQFDD